MYKQYKKYIITCKKCAREFPSVSNLTRLCKFCKGERKYEYGWMRLSSKTIHEHPFCSICETKDQLLVHHKDRNTLNNDPSNLQVLCTPCHASIHRKWGQKVIGIRRGEFGNRLIYSMENGTNQNSTFLR